jgi:hypothetical protein
MIEVTAPQRMGSLTVLDFVGIFAFGKPKYLGWNLAMLFYGVT